jgi:hypothetical protein
MTEVTDVKIPEGLVVMVDIPIIKTEDDHLVVSRSDRGFMNREDFEVIEEEVELGGNRFLRLNIIQKEEE